MSINKDQFLAKSNSEYVEKTTKCTFGF
jgi:hypothetical protein